MVHPENSSILKRRTIQKEGFRPEEEKLWPDYIQKRFDALNLAHNLEIRKLEKLIKENPLLDQPSLYIYLSQRIKEENGKIEIGSKYLQRIAKKIYSFASDKNLDWDLREEIISALANLGPVALEPLKELAKDKDSWIRQQVASVIANLGPVALGTLKELARDKNDFVRQQVASVIGNFGPDALEPLKELARDKNEFVREQVALSLANLGPIALETLEELIKDESTLVCKKAIFALANLGEIALEPLKKLAKNENEEIRQQVALALANLGPIALEPLRELINDENWLVCKKAISAIANLGPDALGTLKELARDKNDFVRQQVASVIGNLGPIALETLEELIKDESLIVRGEATLSLANLGPIALETLKKLAKDKNDFVRQQATLALANLGPIALEPLKELAKDKDSWIRQQVASVIANLGPVALGTLKELARDKNQVVRQKAILAIIEIRKKELKDFLIKSLIVREEPFLANPYVEAIYNPLEEKESLIFKFYEIIDELRREVSKFKKENPRLNIELIGLTILGSLSKGYWLVFGSDIDWGLIWNADEENPKVEKKMSEINKEFIRKVKQLGFILCFDNSVNIFSPQTEMPERLEILFDGLFFGDRKALKKARAKVVNSLTKEKWQEIQKCWNNQLIGYYKTMGRFGFSRKEVRKIQYLRQFLWSLPDYETAKSVFTS